MVVSVSLALVKCAIAGIASMSILSNSKALALAALFRSGVVCAIGALPSGAAMQVPAHCAIVLHGLLCLPILIVIFVGSMR